MCTSNQNTNYYFNLQIPFFPILLGMMEELLKKINSSVKQIYPKLLKYAISLSGNKYDAHDLVMEAIKNVLEKINETSEAPNNLEAYLITSVKNNFKASTKFKKRFVPTEDFEPFLTTTDQQQQSDPLLRKKINEVMFKISDICREILTLSAFGYSYEEIQNTTGIKINTVRSKLSRCRDSFKDKISEALP